MNAVEEDDDFDAADCSCCPSCCTTPCAGSLGSEFWCERQRCSCFDEYDSDLDDAEFGEPVG